MDAGRAMSGRTGGRRYLAGAFLVLGLLVAHLLLMAHEPGHAQHTSHDAAATTAAMSLAMLTVTPDAPATPRSVLDGCPVAQATLPGVLLLLLLMFALGARAWALPLTTAQTWAGSFRAPPPPLAPARRRALLQVFLI